MRCYDFEYDGISLSNKGFIMCSFNSEGLQTVSNGSNITFNTVSLDYGQKQELISSEYKECLSSTFQICKHPILGNCPEISEYESRDIMRWLNRKEYCKIKFIHNELMDVFWECTFNVSKIEMEGKIYGFELEMLTNRPFASGELVSVSMESLEHNWSKIVSCRSDEIGCIYPNMKIEVDAPGTLEIFNELDDRSMIIHNCVQGEEISIRYPLIESNIPSHKIQNDFNWMYFRLVSSYSNRLNKLTISLPCRIQLAYNPIIKTSM